MNIREKTEIFRIFRRSIDASETRIGRAVGRYIYMYDLSTCILHVLASKTKHTKQYTTPCPTHVSSVAPPDSLLAELTRYISFG